MMDFLEKLVQCSGLATLVVNVRSSITDALVRYVVCGLLGRPLVKFKVDRQTCYCQNHGGGRGSACFDDDQWTVGDCMLDSGYIIAAIACFYRLWPQRWSLFPFLGLLLFRLLCPADSDCVNYAMKTGPCPLSSSVLFWGAKHIFISGQSSF